MILLKQTSSDSKLNSCSMLIQIMLAACQRFLMVMEVSDGITSDSGQGWK